MVVDKVEVGEWGRGNEGLEADGGEDATFHIEYVLMGVGVVADIDQVVEFGHLVGLNVLGGDPQC